MNKTAEKEGTRVVPAFAAGTPHPGTLSRRDYLRAVRTYFIEMAPGIKGALKFAKVGGRLSRELKSSARFPPVDSDRLPVERGAAWVEVRLDPSAKVLDAFDEMAPDGSEVLLAPVWYPEFYRWWIAIQTRNVFGAPYTEGDLLPQETHRWPQQLLREHNGCVGWVGQLVRDGDDRGYAAIAYGFGEVGLIDDSRVEVVAIHRDARSVHVRPRSEFIAEARNMGVAMDRDTLIEHQINQWWQADGVDQRWDDADQAMETLERSVAALRRLNIDMRKRDRTLRQDAELDYLTILAVRAIYQALFDLAYAMAFKRAFTMREVLRRFALPGQTMAGRERPAGYEGWPDALVDLAQRPRRARPVDAVAHTIEQMAEAVDRQAQAVHHRSLTLTSPFRSEFLAMLDGILSDVGWGYMADIAQRTCRIYENG